MSRKLWTNHEDAKLSDLFKTTMTASEIAAELGKTTYAVHTHAFALGLKREKGWRTRRAEVFGHEMRGDEMSDTKELLDFAARAMPFTLMPCSCKVQPCRSDNRKHWRPDINSGDCAEMCATLGINTNWWKLHVICVTPSGEMLAIENFADHNNDRAASWRMAALRVAAAIGEAMK